jgi:2-methylcitrate dehydratase PrpD
VNAAVHPTADLVAFAAQAWAFREPERARAREMLLATLQSAIAGAHSAPAEIAAGGAGGTARMHARAIGRPEVTMPLRAALLTGLAVGSDATIATPVICAALALGESVDAAGATVLDAIIAGTEIAVRVERALGTGHLARGWDVRGTCGRIGAAMAGARVLSLQREATRDAFGIAATAASGLRIAAGTMTEAFIIGSAAADGIEATLLARAEFTGAPLALEGRRGLAALMTSTFDAEAAVAGLGTEFVFTAAAPVVFRQGAGTEAMRALAGRVERLASIRELIDATMPP